MLDSKDLLVKFGKFIRYNRVRQEITQTEVAEYMGIAQPQYSRIEAGLRGVDLDFAIKLCHYLNADITEFIREYINRQKI